MLSILIQTKTQNSEPNKLFWRISSKNERSTFLLDAHTGTSMTLSIFLFFTRETKLFYEQEADGILGLGILTNSNLDLIYFVNSILDEQSPPNLLDALSLSNDSYTRAFSLCLAQDGGYFSVNGYNHVYHTSENIQYTEYFPDHHQYRVVINKVQVADQVLSSLSSSDLNKGQGSIVDSGTTMTYFPSVTYKYNITVVYI